MTYEEEVPEGVKRMERLRFHIGHLLAGIALVSVGIAIVISAVLLFRYEEMHSRVTVPAAFNPFEESGGCSVQIQFLAGPFASSQDEKQNFYWGYGPMMEPYVILFTGGLSEGCQKLLDYTYSQESDAVPEPVTIKGRAVTIDNTDIYDYALEFYHNMWQSEELDRNSFKETLGTCYLDATERHGLKKLPWYGIILVFVCPMVFLIAGLVELKRYRMQLKREEARLSSLSEGEKLRALRQLETASELEPGSKIYLTQDYLITGNYQFDMIPYETIGALEETGNYLIAVTVDGIAHIILSSRRKRLNQDPLAVRIKGILKEIIKQRMQAASLAPSDAHNEEKQDAVISGD